jgi:hypothetical protein
MDHCKKKGDIIYLPKYKPEGNWEKAKKSYTKLQNSYDVVHKKITKLRSNINIVHRSRHIKAQLYVLEWNNKHETIYCDILVICLQYS